MEPSPCTRNVQDSGRAAANDINTHGFVNKRSSLLAAFPPTRGRVCVWQEELLADFDGVIVLCRIKETRSVREECGIAREHNTTASR